jgi:hypothetical protein
MKNAYADFLFARPSAAAGVARFFDFGGYFDAYNVSADESEADAKAMYMDWLCVGDSVRSAVVKAQAQLGRGR